MDGAVDDALSGALAALADWLDSLAVPYALIGGVAVSLQATPRYTQDLDAVIWTDDARWPEIVAAAAPFAITPRRPDALEFAKRTRVLLLGHRDGVPIDVSCGALPFEQELIERAAVLDVGITKIRVAQPEHLLVMKAIANRPRDRADIDSLLRSHPTLDTTAVRRVVGEFADALEAPELLDDFDRALRDRR